MACQLTKCCCCVPLRPGLLVWAYTKLILILFSAGWRLFVTLGEYRHTLIMAQYYGRPSLTVVQILFLLFPFGLCFLNLMFTMIFIIGVQHKHYKLLLVFLVYSIIETVSWTGYLGYKLFDVVMWLEYQYYGLAIYSPESFVSTAVYILLSIYLIVLVKSEMQLLKKDGEEASAVLDKLVSARKPLFPVKELERARKELGVKNV